jgi:hypothetical protein
MALGRVSPAGALARAARRNLGHMPSLRSKMSQTLGAEHCPLAGISVPHASSIGVAFALQ